jgi:hypothetical protein
MHLHLLRVRSRSLVQPPSLSCDTFLDNISSSKKRKLPHLPELHVTHITNLAPSWKNILTTDLSCHLEPRLLHTLLYLLEYVTGHHTSCVVVSTFFTEASKSRRLSTDSLLALLQLIPVEAAPSVSEEGPLEDEGRCRTFWSTGNCE